MCKVCDQLRLCTCNVLEEEPKSHYWILYKRYEDGTQTIGDLLLPALFTPEIQQYNNDMLARLLNQGDCFDFDADLKENDLLELNLRIGSKQEKHFLSTNGSNGSKFVSYEFEYKNGKWVDAEWNPFHNNLMQKMQGKMANVFGQDDSKHSA